ncbi:MAG: hypothetical protein ABI333_03610 [bacterium]
MKRERMLEELEQAAEALEIKVVYERLTPEASPGGLCRVGGEYRVIIDRHTPVPDRIGVLLAAIARFPTEGIFLSPKVRAAVERRAGELQPFEAEAEAEAEENP